MARLLGPDFISLQVRDFAAARAFYTERLGFDVDPRFDTPEFVLLASRTIPLALRAATVDLDQAPQPGWGIALWIDCDNVDALHASLVAAGAAIIAPPYDGPFGRTMVIADPDGYHITVNQNPWDRFPLGGGQPERGCFRRVPAELSDVHRPTSPCGSGATVPPWLRVDLMLGLLLAAYRCGQRVPSRRARRWRQRLSSGP